MLRVPHLVALNLAVCNYYALLHPFALFSRKAQRTVRPQDLLLRGCSLPSRMFVS